MKKFPNYYGRIPFGLLSKKTIRVMKLTLFLSMLTLIQLWAEDSYSQITKLTLDIKDVKISDALKEIENKSEFFFLYSPKLIDVERRVDLVADNAPIKDILDDIFGSTVKFAVYDRQIILTAANQPVLNIENQQKSIKGKVTDKSGEPLPGVSIIVTGTTIGTITDLSGDFSISPPTGSKSLSISFMGMQTQVIDIGTSDVINVTLAESETVLDEVVVVGYGTVKKSDLTGSITTVKAKDLTMRPVPTIASALQGQAAGVLVRTQSSAPGGTSSVTIRGINSVMSGSEPLYVVDGIPLQDINSIAPENIESLEVLKDASSTAIYGSRGANGVILITSKKGKSGKPVVTYGTYYSIEKMPTGNELMNAEEFTTLYTEWELNRNPNLTPAQLWYNGSSYDRPLPQNAGIGTDWWKETTQTGHAMNQQFSVSGGGEKNTYSVSLNYLDHKGIIKGGDYNRFDVRTSNTYEINDWVNAGLDLYITRSMKNSSGENTWLELNTGTINAIIKMTAAQSVYAPDGSYQKNTLPGSQTWENPVALANELTDAVRGQRAFGNFYLNIKPLKDLNFKISAGGDANERKTMYYNPSTTIYGGLSKGSALLESNIDSYFITEEILTYKKQIGENRFDLLGGFTYEQSVYENMGGASSNYFTDSYEYNNLAAGSVFDKPYSLKTKWSLASFLGRVNYALKDKYLVSLSGRYDGSSKFGEGNKWGFFPSVAAAWKISDEIFMQDIKWLSNAKLRGSYGSVGNSNIGLYRSLATYTIGNYPIGQAINPGVYATGLENTELKWETTVTAEIAVDFRLFDRVNFTIDAYSKKTNDLLMFVSLIETSGMLTALRNVGELQNRGFEFSADAVVVDKAVVWRIKGDIFTNKSKILKLNGDASQAWKIGQPLGAERGPLIDGIFETQEDLDNYIGADGKVMNGAKLGDYRTVDTNKDGKISGEDNVIIYDPNPRFTYSISNDISYKRFSLNFFTYGTYGNQIRNITGGYLTNLSTIRNNLSKDIVGNYWSTSHPTGVKYPKPGTATTSPVIEDGTFLRIQNIVLSYSIPIKKVKSARVYVSGQNLITLTDYSGYDPDVTSPAGVKVGTGVVSNTTIGYDNASYPTPKVVTFGLDLTF